MIFKRCYWSLNFDNGEENMAKTLVWPKQRLLIMLQDIDELEEHCSGLVVHDSPYRVARESRCSTLDYGILLEMKKLLLGHQIKDFSEEWKTQNFALQPNPKICYGIIQKKGGPCGVLACVQAYLIREIYFEMQSEEIPAGTHQVQIEKRCLALAMSHILWKCGNRTNCVVAFPHNMSNEVIWNGPRDGFSEKIGLFHFNDIQALQKFIISNILWYTFNDFALISFLYSALLSRGIDCVKQDMDDPHMPIIGMHGYCSQELINLLLTGEACSNVFDGNLTLEDDKSNLVLKGIQRSSDIGFLTLMEYYKACKVGQHLKCPQFPIWVVCSESHYTVLFSKEQSIHFNQDLELIKSPMDLFYYDGLVGQEDEIRLTLSHTDIVQSNGGLVPPLELCIRTRWKNVAVDWNGNDPIL